MNVNDWRKVVINGLAATAVVVLSSACSSTSGCAGCNTSTIPGGFPAKKTFSNGVQLRVSQSGLTFLESNLQPLIAAAMPTGLSFAIPPTGCSGSGSSQFKICCKTAVKCNATAEITTGKITPAKPNKVKVNINAKFWTGSGKGSTKKVMKIPVGVSFLGVNLTCDMTFDTTGSKGKLPTATIAADMTMTVAKTDPKKMTLVAGSVDIKNLEAADLTISGSNVICTAFNTFLQTPGVFKTFEPMIKSSLLKPVQDTLNQEIKKLALGMEGRMDLSSQLASFSPSTTAVLDFFFWAGGYGDATESPTAGLSIGALAGFEAGATTKCVPDCEKAGATCKKPTVPTIAKSATFQKNKDPKGNDFHLGIGVHRAAVEQGAYAFYKSGGLCLDVGSETISMVSSGTLAALLSSINVLTGGDNVPARIAIRPKAPPTVTVGKGTYTSSGGTVTITDPLLTLTMKGLAVEFYIMADQRMVRIFTVSGDLAIPVLLYPDAKGKLQPVLGDLSKAFTNLKVTNNDLITEPAATITMLMPTLLGLATSQLAGALPSVDIPSFQGLKLVLGKDAITGVDKASSGTGYDFLAIFAKLAKGSTTTTPSPWLESRGSGPAGVMPRAWLNTLDVPSLDDVRSGRAAAEGRLPTAVLDVSAAVPAEVAGQPLEYAYRLDGGLYTGWISGDKVVIRSAALWLQGTHTVDVLARVKDAPWLVAERPARVSLTVDLQAPRVSLSRDGQAVRVSADDLVDGPDALEQSWSVNGSPFGPFGRRTEVVAPADTEVAVQVRDRAGNIGHARLAGQGASTWTEPEQPELAGGCAVAHGTAGGWALWALLALAVVRRRRRLS